MTTFRALVRLSTTGTSLIRFTFCNNCTAVTMPTTLFVHGCDCGDNVLLKLTLCTVNTFVFVPTTTCRRFAFFYVSLCMLAFNLTFLRAATGPLVVSLKSPGATAHHLGLTRTFGPVKSLSNVTITTLVILPDLVSSGHSTTKRIVFRSLDRTRGTGVHLRSLTIVHSPCIVLKLLMLIMFLVFMFAGVPRAQNRNMGIGADSALHHL